MQTASAPTFSSASRCPSAENRIASSLQAGWTSVLLEHQRARDTADYWTRPTPDQAVLVLTRGQMDLAARREGRWFKSTLEVGSTALTPGGMSQRFCIEPRGTSRSADVAILYIPQGFLDEAADHYRRVGQSFREEPLSSLGFHDPTVAHAIFGLLRAIAAGAPDLYAETVAQWLSTHLLARHASWHAPSSDTRDPGVISDQRLARVIDYMTLHFAEPLHLDRLAREAGISKFHFAHLFRERTGLTPHRYLVQLRMDAARSLLTSTDRTVSEIAASCGYDSPAHFGAAFQRRYKQSPGSYRARQRS